MVGFALIAGALISLFVGWTLSEFIFGKTSSSGYHGTGGRYRTKNKASGMKLIKIVTTGAIAMFLTAPVAAFLAGFGPFGAIVLSFTLVFVYLHLDIDYWNL